MIERVLERIMTALNLRHKTELARLLSVSHAAIYSAINKKKVPQRWLTKLAHDYNLNPNWILTGEGPIQIGEGNPPSSLSEDVKQFDVNLLKKVIEIVEKRLEGKEPALSLEKKAELISLLYEDVLRDESLRDQIDPKAQRLLKLING